MRSFIIASFILLALIGLMICNSVFVTARIDEILALCDDQDALDPQTLFSQWQDCRTLLSMSVNRTELDRAENALYGILSFTPGSEDFNLRLSEFVSAVRAIRDTQCISLENIL